MAWVRGGVRQAYTGLAASAFPRLRGLTLNALGGDTGIDFKTGDVLRVDDVSITGSASFGVSAQRTFVRDSTMAGNVYGLANQPTTSTVSRVTCTNCTMSANSEAGLLSGGLSCSTSLAKTTVVDSVVSGNQIGILARFCGPVYIAHTTINENVEGLKSEGFGGVVYSFQDNRLFNNVSTGPIDTLLGDQ